MRKLITILAMLGMVAFGLVACGSSEEASISWEPPAKMAENEVVANYDCKLFDTDKALEEQPARGPGWWYNTAISGEDEEVTERVFGTTTPSDEDKAALKKQLEDRLKACKPGSEPTVDVTPVNGELEQLPVVAGGDVVRGDSTTSPETPSVVPVAVIRECGTLATWKSLVDCMGDQQWYIDGVNQMKSYTGFDWSDVKKWAEGSKNIDARVIQVYNLEISDEDARDAVRSLIGDAADKLSVVRHGDFVNTRGLEQGTVSPFLDRKQQVRVSLAPLVYTNGKPSGLRADAGVFVDCLNIWAIPKAVGKVPPNPGRSVPPAPSNPPGTVPPTTVPPTTPPTTPPTVPPTTGNPKSPEQDPYPRGNAPQGGGPNATPGPGVQKPYTPPPATPYVPPAPPVHTPPPAPPTVTQQPAPPQPTTVAPGTQPPNHGTVVPTPGGEFG